MRWALTVVLSLVAGLSAAQVPPAAGPYQAEVSRWTSTYLPEIKRSWVAGQIHQESRWRPHARSPVGALGLMQILPATARDIARTCHLAGFDPANPRHAIRGGVCYDAWVWRLVGRLLPGWSATIEDRWAITLRSYNGGAGWLQKESALLADLEIRQGPWVWLGSVCREFRPAPSCAENLDYPVRISQWARLYEGWNR